MDKKYNPIILMLVFCCVQICPLMAQGQVADKYELMISGTVCDRESGKKLENVNVSLMGTSISTVTNAEGYYSLKIPKRTSATKLEMSHIGYANAHYSAKTIPESGKLTANIWMTPNTKQLNEVVVYGDPRNIVKEALYKIPDNYPLSDNMLSTFYRETIQKGHRYIGISEAMTDVYKTSYKKRFVDQDKVQLIKARRLLSQKESDTLAIKVMGGPLLSVNMDIVKNADALFDIRDLDYYEFTQEAPVMIDNRIQYVISFKPCVHLSYPLLIGKVYIDCERLSFTRAEFSLDLSDRDKAIAAILHKKPAGLRFRPQEVSFLVTYRQQGDKTILNYICNEMRFKCDWKKRLFSSSYTARSEMVVVEQEENPEHVINRKDAFKPEEVFYDVVKEYWNEDFWKDYNIIEPTESLENAVNKLKKQL